MKVERQCKILEKKYLSADAISLTLEAGDMVSTSQAHPGQFVHIKCGEGQLLRRPISVCSWTMSRTGDTLTIVFEVRGEGTAWLARRQAGETLDVLGLLGNGFLIRPGIHLLVGGGIGVPPMLWCARETGGASTAILGFRSGDRAILLDEFRQSCAQTLIATDDGSLGFHGFVDALVRNELVTQAPGYYESILACGPKPMLRSVARVAEEFGVPCQVSMEERMGCGVGACLVCACDMRDGTRKHVCKDGPVFDSREVNWDA